MAFGGALGNFVYHELFSPIVKSQSREIAAAADLGLSNGLGGGYIGERLQNAKHEARTNIESPNQAAWKALASYLAFGGGSDGGASSGAGTTEAGAADASYYGAADSVGGLSPDYGTTEAYSSGLQGGAGAGYSNPALIESGTGQEGYGTSSASPGYTSPGDASYWQQLADAGRGYFANNGYVKPAMGLFQMYSGIQNYMAAQERRRQQQEYAKQLQFLMSNPGSVTSLPGYEAGLEAVRRSMAAQGYQGSGNMMAAMAQYGQKAYDDRVRQLQTLQGTDSGIGSSGAALMQLGSAAAMF